MDINRRMKFRPAGMESSDNDSEDDDIYVYQQENNYDSKHAEMPKTTKRNYQHITVYNEEQKLESQMMNACLKNNLDVIQDYLKIYNVNDPLTTGWTPLLYAASAAQADVIKYLLECGADPNKHRDGYTPLMALCSSVSHSKAESLKCLRLFLKADADVDAVSKQRETPLMYACKMQDVEFVRELVKHVKNINFLDGNNRTALFYAVLGNKVETVKMLLEYGVDKTLIDSYSLTAIDVANEKCYKEIISVLDPDEDTSLEFYKEYSSLTWKEVFSASSVQNANTVDFDVSVLLFGMGLEKYCNKFEGVSLKSFLRFTEKDLIHRGLDISAQRKQFINNLHRFHTRKWHAQSIGTIDKLATYTILDGVVTLSVVNKHAGIIASSLLYIQQNLCDAFNTSIILTDDQLLDYKQCLNGMRENVINFKKELTNLKILAKKIHENSSLGKPACHIGPKKNRSNWFVTLSFAITVALLISRTIYAKNLWNTWRYNFNL